MLGNIFGVNQVIERDMLAEPLALRGSVPCNTDDPVLISSFGTLRCATGDSFVTSREEWLIENSVDLVDMELFAIAKVSNYYGIPWRSIKFVTDTTGELASKEWQESLIRANDKIDLFIEKALLN